MKSKESQNQRTVLVGRGLQGHGVQLSEAQICCAEPRLSRSATEKQLGWGWVFYLLLLFFSSPEQAICSHPQDLASSGLTWHLFHEREWSAEGTQKGFTAAVGAGTALAEGRLHTWEAFWCSVNDSKQVKGTPLAVLHRQPTAGERPSEQGCWPWEASASVLWVSAPGIPLIPGPLEQVQPSRERTKSCAWRGPRGGERPGACGAKGRGLQSAGLLCES